MLLFGIKRKKEKLLLNRFASPREKKVDDRKINASRIIFYIMLAFFLLVVLYIVILSDFLLIKNVAVHGNSGLMVENLVEEAGNSMTKSFPGKMKKANYLFFSEKMVEENLKKTFKKIKNIQVEKIFPNTVSINIVEREAIVVYCSDGICHMIDEDGTAYEEIDPGAENLKNISLIRIRDTSLRSIEEGKKAFNPEYISFLLGLREELEKADIVVADEWTASSVISGEVALRCSEGWEMFFSSRTNPEKSVRSLRLFLNEEIKDGRDKLEYVDLRIEDKIYFKVKQEEQEENKDGDQKEDTGSEPENSEDKKKR